MIGKPLVSALALILATLAPTLLRADETATFRAGAAVVDVSPRKLPCIVNGYFAQRIVDQVLDPLNARALALDDGETRVVFCVVDSCMIPRELIDQAKAMASEKTGIPANRMLVSATHTHTATAAMGCLGTPVDPDYAAYLPGKIAEAIEQANAHLQPARIGWSAIDDPDHTHCRRWIRRSDRVFDDPFGDPTVRAHMHPGYQSPDVIGPSGPVDPELSVLAVQSPEGKPIAVLANYSMHYFGASPVSADYYGRFCSAIAKALDAGPEFVAIMSQGTSGDQHWMDYSRPKAEITLDRYASEVADRALEAYRKIEYRDHVPLAMAETTLTLAHRVPDAERIAWAKSVLEAIGDRQPTDHPEIYAREAILLHEQPECELKVQAIRIGDLGIAALPNEVYGLTGLKLKAWSPFASTFTIELANGAEGYIPTPEQHVLGGYTTWPARTAGLEVQAEPRLVETALALLEKVAGQPRRPPAEPGGSYAEAVRKANPLAYWRLDDLAGTQPREATDSDLRADLEPGIALALPGPGASGLAEGDQVNRGIHCAGGRFHVRLDDPGSSHTLTFWFWNGFPNAERPVTGYLASLGPDGAPGAPGDHLGLGGTSAGTSPGRLFVFNGNDANNLLTGSTEIAPRTWHHVALVRDGQDLRVHLDGRLEIEGRLPVTRPKGSTDLFLGGRNDRFAGLEGKLDEVAVFDHALTAEEIRRLFDAARIP